MKRTVFFSRTIAHETNRKLIAVDVAKTAQLFGMILANIDLPKWVSGDT